MRSQNEHKKRQIYQKEYGQIKEHTLYSKNTKV